MRISEVQNFALNSLNKCCKPRKSNENISSNNSLERSPMMDTVSFGRFDERYKRQVSSYAALRLVNNWNAYNVLKDCIYLNLQPTEETKKNPQNDEYELVLISLRAYRPERSEKMIKDSDELMQYHINKFNEIYGFEPGWEKHLRTTEDFEKAAQLANYLDDNGYFPKDQPGEDDWFKNRLFGLDY